MLEQKILMEMNHARTLNLNRWPQSKIAIGFGEKHMSCMRQFSQKKTVQLYLNCFSQPFNFGQSHYSKSQIFVQKFIWFSEKIVDFFLRWKTRENVVVLDFLAVDNFDYTRKNNKKKIWRKTRENV